LKRGKLIDFIIAVILMTFSLGIYQSYISLASSLVLLILLKRWLTEQKTSLIEFFKESGKYLTFIVCSLGVYYGITNICFALTKSTFGSYAAQNINLGSTSVLLRMKICVAIFFSELFEKQYGLVLNCVWGGQIATLVGVILTALTIIQLLLSNKTLFQKIFSVIIIGIYPISVNCMFLFAESSSVHTLVLYSFILVYVLMIVLAENIKRMLLSFVEGIFYLSHW